MKYENHITDRELIIAYASKMPLNAEVNAWGMSNATGVVPLECSRVMDNLVKEGKLIKDGSWYSRPPTPEELKAAEEEDRQFEEDWKREQANEIGMLHGVHAYNDFMGY